MAEFKSKRQIDRDIAKEVSAYVAEQDTHRVYEITASHSETVPQSPAESHPSFTHSLPNDLLSHNSSQNSTGSLHSDFDIHEEDPELPPFAVDIDTEVIHCTASVNEFEDECDVHNFRINLKAWALENKITHTALSSLLTILQPVCKDQNLPRDSRTFLRTPKTTIIKKLNSGEYAHYGLEKNLIKVLSEGLQDPISDHISISVNVDGIPLFKSSNSQFWPILCSINETVNTRPFVVGVYYGKSKPEPLDGYLSDFIDEILSLYYTGITYNSKHFSFCIRNFIADAPARALLKVIKSHTGYSSCEKCNQTGVYHNNRVTFPNNIISKSELRTNASFRGHSDENHHRGVSPLQRIPNFDMVLGFPLDYLHLICLGVVRRMMNYWLKGNIKDVKLSSRDIEKLNTNISIIKSSYPVEFNRKPRGVNELDRWKGSEFRNFLLYAGPIVLKNVLSGEVYNNFILLHCAVSILASPKLAVNRDLCNYANSLMEIFVGHCKQLYGKSFVVYNVHSLLHLAADVKNHGPLDNFSAFKFETTLGMLNNLLQGPTKPLQQLSRRIAEHFQDERKVDTKTPAILLSKSHTSGPLLLNMIGEQYQTLTYKNCKYSCSSDSDNICILQGQKVLKIKNILQLNDGSIHIIGYIFLKYEELYIYPCKSSKLGIFSVSDLSKSLSAFPATAIIGKSVLLELDENKFGSFPLLHV